jgi:hypothetical protein
MKFRKYQGTYSHVKKVKVSKSKVSTDAGNGLFATLEILKGDVICTYGGHLVDATDAKYIDPTYIVNFELGRGYKLVGDGVYGDVGHLSNAVHPEQPELVQNAKFDLRSKQYLTDQRGVFNLIAKCVISKGDEILLDYGDGYWHTKYVWETEQPVKSAATIAREVRIMTRKVLVSSL